jgi:hypothetical protein
LWFIVFISSVVVSQETVFMQKNVYSPTFYFFITEVITICYVIHTVLIEVLVWQNMECFNVKSSQQVQLLCFKGFGRNEEHK